MHKIILAFVFSIYTFTLAAQNSLVNSWDSVPSILSRINAPTFSTSAGDIYDITDYGAINNGTTLSTISINNAIVACNTAGGGTVIIPSGTYLTGAIQLKSNVNLHISNGATLLFSTNPNDYLPLVLTRFEGVECYNYSPFIYAYDQENIAITGSGTLDGNASTANWWDWKTSGDTDRTTLLQMGEDGIAVSSRIFGPGHKIRPAFIQPYTCKNILIDSITILRSPMWEINPVLCENITISNLNINSHGPNNDGCNPECSKEVLIKNCTFDTGDDCIAIKSGRNNDGRRVNVPSENIVIQNCTMKDGHGGVVFGSEISGSVRNVYVEDCVMSSPNLERALRIKTNSVRGGTIENIFLRNIQVPRVASSYIEVNMDYEEGDVGSFTPIVRNIVVENMTGDNSPAIFNIKCYNYSPISNLILKNCDLKASELGNYVNVRKLQIINTTVNNTIPFRPSPITNYDHAELYTNKENWGWSNVYAGYTGNGYMEPVDDVNALEFEFSRPTIETDSIIIRYANPTSTPIIATLNVNDITQSTITFPPTIAGEWQAQKSYINMETGNNTLKIISENKELLIDNLYVNYCGEYLPLEVADNIAKNVQFSISPNPVTTASVIKYTLSKRTAVTFAIYNTSGEKIQGWTVQPSIEGDSYSPFIAQLKAGFYMLKMSSENTPNQSIKFIVK